MYMCACILTICSVCVSNGAACSHCCCRGKSVAKLPTFACPSNRKRHVAASVTRSHAKAHCPGSGLTRPLALQATLHRRQDVSPVTFPFQGLSGSHNHCMVRCNSSTCVYIVCMCAYCACCNSSLFVHMSMSACVHVCMCTCVHVC